jgi:hypothetical protein
MTAQNDAPADDADARLLRRREEARRKRIRDRATRLGLPIPDDVALRYRPIAASREERQARRHEYEQRRYARDREKRNVASKALYARKKHIYNATRNKKRADNPWPYREKAKQDRPKYRRKMLAYLRKWQAENREDINHKRREQYDPGANRQICKESYHRNREARIAYAVEWRKQNPGYETERRKIDLQFRLAKALRGRLTTALRRKRIDRVARTLELCGCDLATLRSHIEAQFQPGMSWDNWGIDGWHIDHRRQLCLYDLTDAEQQRAAFHFSNLRPLWARDNLTRPNRSLRRMNGDSCDVWHSGSINAD